MYDYTWIANLLREIEEFANQSKLTGLSENLALASAALIADCEGRADISMDARYWLEKVAARENTIHQRYTDNIISFPRC